MQKILMKIAFIAAIAGSPLTASYAAPLCDSAISPIEPDFRFSESAFEFESVEAALLALSETIPESAARAEDEGRDFSLQHGETAMIYFNNLHILEGYVLREKALDEQAAGVSEGPAVAAFCDFLFSTPVMD